MNKFILKQLEECKDIILKDSSNQIINSKDLINYDGDTIYISVDSSELSHLRTDKKYKFEFEGYLSLWFRVAFRSSDSSRVFWQRLCR